MTLLFICVSPAPNTLPGTCKSSKNTCWLLRRAGQFLYPFGGNREVVILGGTDQLEACHQLSSSSVASKAVKEWWGKIILLIKGVTLCTLSE